MKMKWSMNMGSLQNASFKKDINPLRNMSVNTMLLALVGMALFVLVAMAGFGFYSLNKQGSAVVESVDNTTIQIEELILSQKIGTLFRLQVQEWKNILLRGDDQEDYDKYLGEFEKKEIEVQITLMDMRFILNNQYNETTNLIDKIVRLHAHQGAQYREALESFDMEAPRDSGMIVDTMVRGVDVALQAEMEKLTRIIDKKIKDELAEDRRSAQENLQRNATIFIISVTIAFSIIIIISLPIRNGVNKSVQHINELRDGAEQQNQRNQTAILQLLDEVADLADGDLTRKPVVTEEVTGALADSLGSAIETLRRLVGAINSTAVQVASEATATQEKALQLTAASDRQTQSINAAGTAVTEMTKSIEQVSQDALESSSVAKKSVDIAKKGAQTVQGTIQGMETIREQIQETSKRIKRLGESSQEIGDIVGLIHGIAYQTNILALNAAIQAAMAGEAGRGFSVVADEVQRLSKRVSNSTKQIEDLVKAIQKDTSEAVISMEKSTSGVVFGTRLVQDAGKALSEIETVSINLDKLIEGISSATRQQSNTASKVSNLMDVIQDITTQTSKGTRQAAESIGQLTGIAGELKKSVAGFKLPS